MRVLQPEYLFFAWFKFCPYPDIIFTKTIPLKTHRLPTLKAQRKCFIMRQQFLFLFCLFTLSLTAQLPDDFYDQIYLDNFDFATGFTFDEQGFMYVWEKKGMVHRIDTNGQRQAEPFLDLREEVSNWKDHGLLGFALDPNFTSNGRCYALYTVDLHHYFHYGTPQYKADSTVTFHPTFGRVVRYQAKKRGDDMITDPDTRKILLGEEITNGIPLLYEFHGLGSLLAANDGTLLISCGDATGNETADTGGNPNNEFIQKALELGIITEDQDLGSYRAQYLGNLNGKVLRIDAETGDGLPSNPYFDAAAPRSPQSRVWLRGLRNPYRIVLEPETGSHYAAEGDPGTLLIGDVGNGSWEELNRAETGGLNFGWPLIEGINLMWAFWSKEVPENPMAPNPLYGQGCDQAFFTFKQLMVRTELDRPELPPNPCNPNEPIHAEAFPSQGITPLLTWSNANWNKPARAMTLRFDEHGDAKGLELSATNSPVEGENFDGFSSMAGVFYTGDVYPAKYQGDYFTFDFSGWIKHVTFNDNGALTSIEDFHNDAGNIIHMDVNPKNGLVYYLNLEGQIHEIPYGGNPPPKAILQAEPHFGASPLTVQFDAGQSYDEQQPITDYRWDFGDGTTSTDISPNHTFDASGSEPESFTVKLTVTDSAGAAATTERIVSLNNSPPQATISSFRDGAQYPMDRTTLLHLEADVTDAEHEDASLQYEWKVYLHHNDHFHPEPTDFNHTSYALISPLGCQTELYWYRVELTVTDPAGLSTTDTRTVHPYCGPDFIQWMELDGRSRDKAIDLQWTTDLEDSIEYYVVQRTSDFFHFETIGQVSAAGAGSSYVISDLSPMLGDNIYRIKAVRASGAYDYSKFATVAYPKPVPIRLSPNPAHQFVGLQVRNTQSDRIHFELFSMAGIRLRKTDWEATPGARFEKTIGISQLPAGVYLYRVLDGDRRKVGKLVVR